MTASKKLARGGVGKVPGDGQAYPISVGYWSCQRMLVKAAATLSFKSSEMFGSCASLCSAGIASLESDPSFAMASTAELAG
jgi:hypothetical protein